MTLSAVPVTRNGQKLSQSCWDLIADVEGVTGKRLTVVQGGYKDPDGPGGVPSSGASASAGVHDMGDVFDVSRGTFTDAELTAIATAFRRRGVCFWWRLRRYGWTSTGEHGHGVRRNSPAGLAYLAKAQVVDYDRGLDGLAHSSAASRPFKGKDYHPRPKQYLYPWPSASLAKLKRGTVSRDAYLTQVALGKYVGLDFSSGVVVKDAVTRGTWGPRSIVAWGVAAVKARRTGVNLLRFLGEYYGGFKGTV
jgi:hypothetical protein